MAGDVEFSDRTDWKQLVLGVQDIDLSVAERPPDGRVPPRAPHGQSRGCIGRVLSRTIEIVDPIHLGGLV